MAPNDSKSSLATLAKDRFANCFAKIGLVAWSLSKSIAFIFDLRFSSSRFVLTMLGCIPNSSATRSISASLSG